MKLLDGEVICNKCKGTGKQKNSYYPDNTCTKCLGKGKLDWVSNAMAEKEVSIFDWKVATTACESNITEELYKYMAEEFARKIDREILKGLYTSYEEQKNIDLLNNKFGKEKGEFDF